MSKKSKAKPRPIQRRFSHTRFNTILLMILGVCPHFTLLRVLNVLFRADLDRYRETGRTITGATWIKTEHGPIPFEIMTPAEQRKCKGSDGKRLSRTQRRGWVTLQEWVA